MNRWSAKSAFTMVELLMVIAVISLLAALTVANVGDLGASRSLDNAGSNVRDLISRARNTARSHSSLTMFVTPITGEEKDQYKVFAILERTNDSPTWKQITQWERLPEGIILDKDKSEVFLNSATATTNIALPVLKQKGKNINPGGYAFALFSPEGGLEALNDLPPVLHFKRDKPNETNYYEVVINNTTGIPIIKRP